MLDDDLVVIQDYCRRAAIAAVADLVRQHEGELIVTSSPLALPQSTEVVDAPVARHVTVTPAAYSPPPTDWLVVCWRVTKVLMLLGAAAAIVWMAVVIWQSLVAAIAAVIPTLVIIGAIIAVISMLSMLGGGRRTGGFSGTWWTH